MKSPFAHIFGAAKSMLWSALAERSANGALEFGGVGGQERWFDWSRGFTPALRAIPKRCRRFALPPHSTGSFGVRNALQSFVLAVIFSTNLARAESVLLFSGQGETQSGVHGKGNVYAPDVHFYDGKYWMWFGGQGREGHDRIHLAQSSDGKSWKQLGVVLDNGSANHVNDPSVIRAKGQWWMYYTVAKVDVIDEIALAVSKDGVKWEDKGVVLSASKPPAWDSLLVGRPSVLHEKGMFKMWYDGCKELPLNAPAKNVPKSASAQKFVGYAESKDGLKWERKAEPIFDGATALHVSRFGKGYLMVFESGAGTKFATSQNGLAWKHGGMLVEKNSSFESFGHVTPFLFRGKSAKPTLYIGAAREKTWDVNSVAIVALSDEIMVKIKTKSKEIESQ